MKKSRILGLSFLINAALVAQPMGMRVDVGHADQAIEGNVLTISCRDNTMILWDDFSVSAHETVKFDQECSNSIVLIRVEDGEESFIYGNIESNGKVYFINSAGIRVDSNAEIKTGGFLASTGTICDDDLLDGGDLTLSDFGEGAIHNLGKIETKNGGITLVAKRVLNVGKLYALENHINISSAGQVEKAIENLGEIKAGTVSLVAENSTVDVFGEVNAPGGTVVIVGNLSTTVHENAIIDVSDNHRPGKAFIGGSFRGQDASMVHSDLTIVKKGAVINADAKKEGNGGQVVVWSNGKTVWDSEISAQALTEGIGGLIEVSTKGDRGAIKGRPNVSGTLEGGQVLYDPKFAYIQSDGTDPATGNTFGSDPSESVIITGASVAAALETGSLTIQANTDIVVADSIVPTTGNNGLSLEAGRSVQLTELSDITLDDAPFSVIINDENCEGDDREDGVAVFSVGEGCSIHTQGGNISVTVGTQGGFQEGIVMIDGGALVAAGGDITVDGFGAEVANNNKGIVLSSDASITTSGVGAIALNGRGSTASESNACGVFMESSTLEPATITTENGTLSITGVAGGSSIGNNNVGCTFNSAIISSTGTGAVIVTGTGGSGVNNNMGIQISGQGANITSETGSVSIVGNGNGSGEFNYGIRVESGAKVSSTGTATVSLNGTGGDGGASNRGVIITGKYTDISSTGGDIALTGIAQGFGSYNQGVLVENRASLTASNAAAIAVSGSAAPGQKYDVGIFVSGQSATITSVDGDITLTGVGQGEGNSNEGVILEYPQNVQATGAGIVTVNSTSE